MDENLKKRFNILAIFLIAIFCFSITPITFQNDTYYTIAIGEHISKNGIDMQDPFSWHENLPYTYPHWLYDLGTYYIYHLGESANFGFQAIYISTIVLSIILGIVIYITNTKICKDNIVSFFVTIGTMYLLKSYVAARAQLVTFILFALTILFIERYIETRHKRYLVGLLIIPTIIANVHVAVWPFYFVLFLPYIAEYFFATVFGVYKKVEMGIYHSIYEKRKKKNKNTDKIKEIISSNEKVWNKIEKKQEESRANPYKIIMKNEPAIKALIVVMILAVFTGLLTPLGTTPYTYLIKTRAGNTMNNISEHLPLTLFENKAFTITLGLFFLILIFSKVKVRLRDFFMMGGLLFLSFMTRRQISMFVLICNFIFAKMLVNILSIYAENFLPKFSKAVTTNIGGVILVLAVAALSFYIFKPKINDKIVSGKSYPVDAANYILKSLDIENIRLFNEYNYGSYLLFRGIPVFIDSRADLYAPEFNKTVDENGNVVERDIFGDFMNISSMVVHYDGIFEKYDITHAIIKKSSKVYNFIAKDKNYKVIYEDKNFVVYERENEKTE